MTTAEISLGVLVGFNAGALIWGAATMKSEVKALKETIVEVKGLWNDFRELVSGHSNRLSIAENDGSRALTEIESLRNQIVSGFEDLRVRVRNIEIGKSR